MASGKSFQCQVSIIWDKYLLPEMTVVPWCLQGIGSGTSDAQVPYVKWSSICI